MSVLFENLAETPSLPSAPPASEAVKRVVRQTSVSFHQAGTVKNTALASLSC